MLKCAKVKGDGGRENQLKVIDVCRVNAESLSTCSKSGNRKENVGMGKTEKTDKQA